MATSSTDILFPVRALTQAITNLDRRIRRVENREVGVPEVEPCPLNPGWTQAGGQYAPLGCYRNAAGSVHMQGTVSAGPALPAIVTVLPPGMRPIYRQVFHIPTNAVADIMPNGNVVVQSGTFPMSFDVINFRAEQ